MTLIHDDEFNQVYAAIRRDAVQDHGQDAKRYHYAMLEALNGIHANGYQHGVAVAEGVAHLVAQLTASMNPDFRAGFIRYICRRGDELAESYVGEYGTRHELVDTPA
jgi:hypothetical protein